MKLKSALALAATGLRVFPITPNSKRPAIDGWKEKATADPAAVERWWAENPDYNIGVRTGDRLFVVDADTKKDAPGLDSLAMLDMLGLPDSFRVATPSGGTHVYLHTDRMHRNRVNSIENHPGIDIRATDADGKAGYVLGPGSTIDGKPYRDIGAPTAIAPSPAWFDDMLEQAGPKHTPHSDQPLIELDKPANIDKAVHYLTHNAPEAIEGAGGDDTTYRVAARLRDMGLSRSTALELLLEHWNETKASPPWQPDDLAVKVENAFDYASGGWGAHTAEAEFGTLDIDIGEPPAAANDDRPAPPVDHTTLARPYRWCDPASIPKRDWILGKHLIRKFVSVTVAPGNIGKSSLTIAEALEMATARNLIGHDIEKPLRVWYWNLEDPYDELQRRIQAAAQHYGIQSPEIENTLFVNSGRDTPLRIATTDHNGTKIAKPMVDAVVKALKHHQMDVLVVDPFVSSHSVSENDNTAIDMVAKAWGAVADKANVAIELVHHTRKTGAMETETTTESARGGKALTDAARDVRVLNRMSAEEAAKGGIEHHRLHFRTYSDKANMAPPADRSDWFRLESVALANGDEVGVVTAWEWPDPFEDITADHVRRVQDAVRTQQYRVNVQSSEWVGVKVAEIVGLDIEVASEKERVKALVRTWLEKGWLRKVSLRDAKGKDRPVVEAGDPVQEDFESVEI